MVRNGFFLSLQISPDPSWQHLAYKATTVVIFFPEAMVRKGSKTQALVLQRPALKSWLPITSWVIQL